MIAPVFKDIWTDKQYCNEDFKRDGYVKVPVHGGNPHCHQGLHQIMEDVVRIICDHLDLSEPKDYEHFLSNIHTEVYVDQINSLRMLVYNKMNELLWLRTSYFQMTEPYLYTLVGNELAMQNKVNFSIQMVDDTSSVLPAHIDAFSGESPFQVVVWVPMMSTSDSNAMFILPPDKHRAILPHLPDLMKQGKDAVFEAIKDDIKFINVKLGQALIFSPNYLHGNVVNKTDKTRWSMNARFKSLFSPYCSPEKTLGGFYLPTVLRPVTELGLDYGVPDFHG